MFFSKCYSFLDDANLLYFNGLCAIKKHMKNMKVVILAGGMGTRLSEETDTRPKPMVEIGGKPILWHIMKYYSAFGFKEFVIALGYKGHLIKDFFVNYHLHHSDLSVDIKDGSVRLNKAPAEDWRVHLVDTGLHSGTAGRLKMLKSYLKGTFLMTYGDGVSNVDLTALITHHRRCKKAATLTAVRPPARFGNLSFKGTSQVQFSEKSQVAEGWINGGFFVLEPKVLDLLDDTKEMFEQRPLETLSVKGQLNAYKHEGFWQCMDTLRDVKLLNQQWDAEQAPWRIW